MEDREYEEKLLKLKTIIAEGDEQLNNGDCGPYSLEDLNRDCADTISD